MRKLIKTKTARILPLAALLLATGCLKENAGNCADPDCILIVRAYDNSGAELTKTEVSSVMIYTFDSKGYYMESFNAELGDSIKLATIEGEDMQVVAWGNVTERSSISVSDNLEQSGIELISSTRIDGYARLEDDIFLGNTLIAAEKQKGENEVYINRQLGSMSVTVKGLDGVVGTGTDLSFIIGETWSRISFLGELSGDRVRYSPEFSREAGLYGISPFMIVPEEEGIYIDIISGERSIATITKNNDGSPLAVYPGQLTNVLVEFKGPVVNVTTTLAPWGEVPVWKDF